METDFTGWKVKGEGGVKSYNSARSNECGMFVRSCSHPFQTKFCFFRWTSVLLLTGSEFSMMGATFPCNENLEFFPEVLKLSQGIVRTGYPDR